MPALSPEDRTKLKALIDKVTQANDQRYALTLLLGRYPLPNEVPKEDEPLLSALMAQLHTAKLKKYKSLRKFEGPGGQLSFEAWKKAVGPLVEDLSIPENVRKEYLLDALSPQIYNLAVGHEYVSLPTCKEIMEALAADWEVKKDVPTLASSFYQMCQNEDEDHLSWVQRLRVAARGIQAIKASFEVLKNVLLQIKRGSRDQDLVVRITVDEPDTEIKLIEAVKAFVVDQQITDRLADMAVQNVRSKRQYGYGTPTDFY